MRGCNACVSALACLCVCVCIVCVTFLWACVCAHTRECEQERGYKRSRARVADHCGCSAGAPSMCALPLVQVPSAECVVCGSSLTRTVRVPDRPGGADGCVARGVHARATTGALAAPASLAHVDGLCRVMPQHDVLDEGGGATVMTASWFWPEALRMEIYVRGGEGGGRLSVSAGSLGTAACGGAGVRRTGARSNGSEIVELAGSVVWVGGCVRVVCNSLVSTCS